MALASSVISGAKGTGTFSSASDAMGNVGSMMKSPAQGKAEKMKVDGKSIDLTGPDGIDEFAKFESTRRTISTKAGVVAG